MGGVPIAVQQLVGGVHRRKILRAGPETHQKILYVFGRGLKRAKRQHGGRVERAGIGFQTNWDQRFTFFQWIEIHGRKILAQLGGDVPRQAAMAHHVAPVGGDVHIQHWSVLAVRHSFNAINAINGETKGGDQVTKIIQRCLRDRRQFLLEGFQRNEHQSSPPMDLRKR